MTIFERFNQLGEEEVAAATRLKMAGDGKSWVCPVCGNGEGERGDGIRQKVYQGRLTWHCYSGKHDGAAHMSNCDIFAAAEGISDNATLARRLEEMYPQWRSENFFPSRGKNFEATKAQKTEESTRRNFAKMYEIQQRALSPFLTTQGGTWRGLTIETLKAAGAGYNTKYKSVILPYDEYTFFWRSVETKERRINKGGKRRLYVPCPAAQIKTGDLAINFLTEGEIDSLSVVQALKHGEDCLDQCGVAATGSAKFIRLTLDGLNAKFEACAAKPKIIWLGDNDEAGVKSAENFVKALNAAGYPAVAVFFAEIGEPKLDANQFLQNYGTFALKKRLANFVDENLRELDNQAEKFAEAARQKEIEAALAKGIKSFSLTEYLSTQFDKDLDNMAKYSGRATGFDNLDEKQLFLPSLIILGGTPGAGKTSFVWQLLSQVATGDESRGRKPEYCVYCSYEMSALELASKSIAREIRCRHFAGTSDVWFSSSRIRRGEERLNSSICAARKKFLQTASNLRILELSNTPLDELICELKKASQAAGAKPLTVAIDYLQLIPVGNSKATAKERIDEVMLKLKTFQRETNSTLIVISSLNRDACINGGERTPFSFKESGSIEYSADVTWALIRDGNQNDASDDYRKVTLKCTKNRSGAIYNVKFCYYAASDYFCACEQSKDQPQGKTKNCRNR